MKNGYKRIILIVFIMLLIILCTILFVDIYRNIESKQKVEHVLEVFYNTDIQEKLENTENNNILDFAQPIDGKKVIGTIRIDKINFEGLVYEGTDLDTLRLGVRSFY